MKAQLETLLSHALATLKANGTLPADFSPDLQFERTRDPSHGDWACNIALMSAKAAGKKPRDVAEQIVAALPASAVVSNVEIAGPGFINFFLSADSRFAVVRQVLDDVKAFASPNIGNGEKVLLEYVSANPTGPMHVGHGRGAAYGSALATILSATGFNVHREYYINDAGRQADVLAVSVYLRYLEACGETVRIPSRAYPADYVRVCGEALLAHAGRKYFNEFFDVVDGLPDDPEGDGDDIKMQKEDYLDAII